MKDMFKNSWKSFLAGMKNFQDFVLQPVSFGEEILALPASDKIDNIENEEISKQEIVFKENQLVNVKNTETGMLTSDWSSFKEGCQNVVDYLNQPVKF